MDYYVKEREEYFGPFSLDQLRLQITPSSLIKRAGERDWQPPQNFPELQGHLATPSIDVAQSAPSQQSQGISSKPWDPQTIVWLGLLFTPIWSGVMAALNEQRLNSQRSTAPGLWIAGLWLAADFVIYPWLGWGLLATWITTAVCLSMLWAILVEQQKDFAQLPAEQDAEHYGLPVLAGLPALVMLCVQAYGAAMAPLSPYEICQRFQKAKAADQTPLVTSKMKELLADVERFQRAGGTMSWELSKDSKKVYSLPPDKSLVPIKFKFNNDYRFEEINGDAFVQLIPDPKQDYLLDDFVIPIPGKTAFNSMHAERATAFVYNAKPQNVAASNTSPPPSRPLSKPNNSDLRRYVVPAAIATKSALPTIGKFLAVVGIGALALVKGFFSTAPKREETP